MKILFSVDFHTTFGQNVYVVGSIPELGNNKIEKAPLMEYGPHRWSLSIKISHLKERVITYRYFVKDQNGNIIPEVGSDRILALSPSSNKITLLDGWQGNTFNAPFLRTPFSNIYLAHESNIPTQTHKYSQEVIIKVLAPNVEKNGNIYICGNCKTLGMWNTDDALPLLPIHGAKWEIHLQGGKLPRSFEYKFIKKMDNGDIVWEDGENHSATLEEIGRGETLSIEHSAARFSFQNPKYAGCAIPVFSLRSESDCGIGEFLDIKQLAQWCRSTGQQIIQLLPINDTTTDGGWNDSYPYNCISVNALHPIYINLQSIAPLSPEEEKEFEEGRKRLNEAPFVEYDKVFRFKMKYARILFERYGEEVATEPKYYSFYKSNKEWLLPYSRFSSLRNKYGTADFRSWNERYNPKRTPTKEDKFYIFLQYQLWKQLLEAVEYTHSLGVALKGDIPIGISPCSVEAWTEPELFHLDSQAGAPPDAFSADGQNWGFPTYNWEAMAKDGFAWWKKRLGIMSQYFDAYRIDHILGFFRIWEIPRPLKSGLLGHFSPALPLTVEEIKSACGKFVPGLYVEDPIEKGLYHPRISPFTQEEFETLSQDEKERFYSLHHNFYYIRHNKFWEEKGYEKLPELISASNMLPCAEDLGMIPDCVPEVLHNLKILTLEIERMPKEFGKRFGDPAHYPYLSVCATGTHDMNTLRGWWKEDRELTREYYRDSLHGKGNAPILCTPNICKKIIQNHLDSPAMFTILPLQDWLSLSEQMRVANPADERINTPSNRDNQWRYRMNVSLETLKKSSQLNEKILDLIKEGGRLS